MGTLFLKHVRDVNRESQLCLANHLDSVHYMEDIYLFWPANREEYIFKFIDNFTNILPLLYSLVAYCRTVAEQPVLGQKMLLPH